MRKSKLERKDVGFGVRHTQLQDLAPALAAGFLHLCVSLWVLVVHL